MTTENENIYPFLLGPRTSTEKTEYEMVRGAERKPKKRIKKKQIIAHISFLHPFN